MTITDHISHVALYPDDLSEAGVEEEDGQEGGGGVHGAGLARWC